jgi:hypothetical protein
MRIAPLIKEISVKTTIITDSIHRVYKTILLAGSNYDRNSLNGKIKIRADLIQLIYTICLL